MWCSRARVRPSMSPLPFSVHAHVRRPEGVRVQRKKERKNQVVRLILFPSLLPSMSRFPFSVLVRVSSGRRARAKEERQKETSCAFEPFPFTASKHEPVPFLRARVRAVRKAGGGTNSHFASSYNKSRRPRQHRTAGYGGEQLSHSPGAKMSIPWETPAFDRKH